MEDKELKELLELSRANSKILHSMQRTAMFYRVVKVFYWSLIIGSLFGTYYYVQPYIDKLLEIYKELYSSPVNVGSPTDMLGKLDSLIKKP